MVEHNLSRRATLQTTGAVALGAIGLAGLSSATGSWTTATSPTDEDLYDVAYATDGAYAVGGGGVVLERSGGSWTKIVDGGASGNGNGLHGADVTDDGERLWFVGTSGEVGEYDVSTGTLYDHSQPGDTGDNLNDVAVTGRAGEANVYAACDSGHVHYSFENGESQTWEYVTPGSGAALTAIDFYDARSGHLVDTNQKVFETDDGGTWEAIGIADANVNFYGVDSDASDDVWVSGGNGMTFHWNGSEWTATDLGDASLRDVEVTDDDSAGYTVGSGGNVFHRESGSWHEDDTPTGANLKAIVRGSPDIAVGASGTIVEN